MRIKSLIAIDCDVVIFLLKKNGMQREIISEGYIFVEFPQLNWIVVMEKENLRPLNPLEVLII